MCLYYTWVVYNITSLSTTSMTGMLIIAHLGILKTVLYLTNYRSGVHDTHVLVDNTCIYMHMGDTVLTMEGHSHWRSCTYTAAYNEECKVQQLVVVSTRL